eukprot:TRINITY_DN16260_c0_g1_i5.p1 TRINITY_DN16260_c0_g1~~TRINITY_DN16260_c0_g1_i5.p1  ORF type:complete len:703 (-),score=88.23 TRINITY_DN16260_c0_g1_i5:51-2159(-)
MSASFGTGSVQRTQSLAAWAKAPTSEGNAVSCSSTLLPSAAIGPRVSPPESEKPTAHRVVRALTALPPSSQSGTPRVPKPLSSTSLSATPSSPRPLTPTSRPVTPSLPRPPTPTSPSVTASVPRSLSPTHHPVQSRTLEVACAADGIGPVQSRTLEATCAADGIGAVQSRTSEATFAASDIGPVRSRTSEAAFAANGIGQSLSAHTPRANIIRQPTQPTALQGLPLPANRITSSVTPLAIPSNIENRSRPDGSNARVTVAVDVDEVLVRYMEGFRQFFQQETQTSLDAAALFREAHDPQSPWRMKFAMEGGLDRLEPVPGAADGLRRLLAAGCSLEVVTSRPPIMRQSTEALLHKLFPPGTFTAYHFVNASEKGRTCRARGAVALIDDQIPNVICASNCGVLGLLFDLFGSYSWSMCDPEYLPAGVHRLQTWQATSDFLIENFKLPNPDPSPLHGSIRSGDIGSFQALAALQTISPSSSTQPNTPFTHPMAPTSGDSVPALNGTTVRRNLENDLDLGDSQSATPTAASRSYPSKVLSLEAVETALQVARRSSASPAAYVAIQDMYGGSGGELAPGYDLGWEKGWPSFASEQIVLADSDRVVNGCADTSAAAGRPAWAQQTAVAAVAAAAAVKDTERRQQAGAAGTLAGRVAADGSRRHVEEFPAGLPMPMSVFGEAGGQPGTGAEAEEYTGASLGQRAPGDF